MQSLDANTAKHWVKMVKLCDIYNILWYFEKGLMDSWTAYEWTWVRHR